MPSTVLNGDVPYNVLFPNKSLFPVEPRLFGSTCYVHDVRPSITKLDPKALKYAFLGYSRLEKGYRCYSPYLHKYLVSTDVVFSENTPFFSSPSMSTSQGEEDQWLIYQITHPSAPTEQSNDRALVERPPAPTKPPITHIYSRRQETNDTCPAPATSSSDPPNDLDLPISLHKGKRQCTFPKSIYPIAKFISYDHVSLEILWIQHLLTEVGLKPSVLAKLWCDNQVALHITSNPVYHERTKRIEVDCHFIREKIQENLISTGYVKIGEQFGDIFTKALNGNRFEFICNKLDMINIYAPA